MKKYPLLISKAFLSYHPKAGQETGFIPKIIKGEKIHTVRENFDYWKPRIDAISRREGILSIRQWSGDPYKSNQITFMNLPKAGIQRFDIINGRMYIERNAIEIDQNLVLVKNDGFEYNANGLRDFIQWLKADKRDIRKACIIHFTDFRYGS